MHWVHLYRAGKEDVEQAAGQFWEKGRSSAPVFGTSIHRLAAAKILSLSVVRLAGADAIDELFADGVDVLLVSSEWVHGPLIAESMAEYVVRQTARTRAGLMAADCTLNKAVVQHVVHVRNAGQDGQIHASARRRWEHGVVNRWPLQLTYHVHIQACNSNSYRVADAKRHCAKPASKTTEIT